MQTEDMTSTVLVDKFKSGTLFDFFFHTQTCNFLINPCTSRNKTHIFTFNTIKCNSIPERLFRRTRKAVKRENKGGKGADEMTSLSKMGACWVTEERKVLRGRREAVSGQIPFQFTQPKLKNVFLFGLLSLCKLAFQIIF